ncbi:hypothetical protein Cagg_0876 [Chloroflexus aggregans DSM 9485]|uniref:Secreted protein n=1 Tax=Chloroflexus aggregans (strain MD-66 / DSM 9485) TaxID=326427 RepID=B8G5T4_CHLAD|nr:hypothetical protein Cagg_0876 [Chloroflexus aggregans DSM 9485]
MEHGSAVPLRGRSVRAGPSRPSRLCALCAFALPAFAFREDTAWSTAAPCPYGGALCVRGLRALRAFAPSAPLRYPLCAFAPFAPLRYPPLRERPT